MKTNLIHLVGVSVDPLSSAPKDQFAIADNTSGQHIVQLTSAMSPAIKAQLEAAGAKVVGYFPDSACLVRIAPRDVRKVKKLPFVRATMGMPDMYKLDTGLRDAPKVGLRPDIRSVVVSTVGHDTLQEVARDLRAQGFKNLRFGHDTIVADGTLEQIQSAVTNDDILWIGPDSAVENDLDNIRKVGGADFLAANTPSGFQGDGIRVHVFEGIEAGHPAFAANEHRKAPIAVKHPEPDGHGHATAGIIGGDGEVSANKWAKGVVPHAQIYYTNKSAAINLAPGSREPESRWAITKEVVEQHNVDSQTASWGNALTTKYDERSRELDGIMCDFDLAVTQSQSNNGDPQSRPQAWAKNVISVTALYHFDNANFDDDRWNGGASTRNPAEGRIGRTLSGFYDKIGTTALGGKYRDDFGGTSGATPQVNGHIDAIIQMFKEGAFQSVLLNPAMFTPGQHPWAATTAAIAIASARQHPFKGRTVENNRFQQGWGTPDNERLFKARGNMLIVNEDQALKTGDSARYSIDVADGEPELKVSLVWKDPPALVSAGKVLVNDLDLKVTAPDGTVYLGNVGLLDGNYSTPGGEADRIDAVENVFVEKPKAGRWTVEVVGTAINQPVTGTALEAKFALVTLGGKKAAS